MFCVRVVRSVCGWGFAGASTLHHQMLGRLDLEGEDDDLALIGVLHAGVAVRLEARVGRERDLLLTRILPRHRT